MFLKSLVLAWLMVGLSAEDRRRRSVFDLIPVRSSSGSGAGSHCRCQDGSHACIVDERLQCRRSLEVLGDNETLQDTDREQRQDRRKNRRMLKRLFRKWMREELERGDSHLKL